MNHVWQPIVIHMLVVWLCIWKSAWHILIFQKYECTFTISDERNCNFCRKKTHVRMHEEAFDSWLSTESHLLTNQHADHRCTPDESLDPWLSKSAQQTLIKPWCYKTFFLLNIAEHEIFSANKYENTNNSWHFHIYLQRNFHAQLCLARNNL